MTTAARKTFIAGLILLLGSPIAATLFVLLQKPTGGTGAARSGGELLSTIIVANFATTPLLFIGLILLLVSLFLHKKQGLQSPPSS